MNRSDLITKTSEFLRECCSSSMKHPTEKPNYKLWAENAVDAVLSCITKGLTTDGNVQIIGFGTFSVTERASRQGVNPRTGKKITIKASKGIKFRAGVKLKEIL